MAATELVRASVTQVSPLKVRVDGATTANAAEALPGFVPVVGARVWAATVGTQLLVLAGGGGGGSAPTKAQIDALDVDADTLDGFDSLAFLQRSRWNARKTLQQNVMFNRPLWDGTTFTWSDWIRLIPGGAAANNNVAVTTGSKAVPAWNVAYLRLTDAQVVGNVTLAPADVSVESYTTYVAQENDIVLAVNNGDDGRLHLADGTILDYWRAPALLNSWVNYGSGYSTAGYRKDASGLVHVRGFVKAGSASGAVIFTLPAGYRPGMLTAFGQTQWSGGPGVAELDITTAGDLKWYGAAAPSWIVLDGITFLAEQ